MPARDGPDGTQDVTGHGTGFVLAGQGLPRIYVSGDNASLRGHLTEGPDQIADAFAGSGLSGRLVLLEPGQSASV